MIADVDRFAPDEPCQLDQTCVLPDGHHLGDRAAACTDVTPPCPSCGARAAGLPTWRPTRPAPLPATHRAAVATYLEAERPGEAWVPGEVPTGDRNRDL